MKTAELLTVEHTFFIARGDTSLLILYPDFPIPEDYGSPVQRVEQVSLLRPDGSCIEATAQINVSHLNIPAPDVPWDARWRITIVLTDRKKDEVPVGSKLLVAEDVRDAILRSARDVRSPANGLARRPDDR